MQPVPGLELCNENQCIEKCSVPLRRPPKKHRWSCGEWCVEEDSAYLIHHLFGNS